MNYTINNMQEALKSGEITSVSLVKKSIETFEEDKKSKLPLNAFLEMYSDAITKAESADKEIADAKASGSLDKLFDEKPLIGLPFADRKSVV